MKNADNALSDAYLDTGRLESISLRLLREEFESNPPQTRTERLAHIEELRRKRPKSYLARNAKRIYGI